MKFGIDAHAIGQKLTGNEVYVRNLLKGFATHDRQSEFVAYVASEEANNAVPERFEIRNVSTNPFVRLGVQFPRMLAVEKPDLFHVQYTAPWNCPVPVVVSVHDVSFLEHPEYFSRARAMQLKVTVKRTVERAARIITPSDFSRQAVARAYGLDPQRISVIHNAVSHHFRPIQREVAAGHLLRKREWAFPYVLTVGDIQPRKNHIGLIRAFANVLREHPQLPHHLVMAGKETWFTPEVKAVVKSSGIAERIHFTGFVDDAELLQLYGGCDVFAFPSFYEGFGIPILEAMACGRAVVCSNTTAMPEVADSAALLFDPKSDEQIGRALRDLMIDPALRMRTERLGLQRATLFSWDRASQQTLEVYYSVAKKRPKESKRAVPVARP